MPRNGAGRHAAADCGPSTSHQKKMPDMLDERHDDHPQAPAAQTPPGTGTAPGVDGPRPDRPAWHHDTPAPPHPRPPAFDGQ